MLLIVHNFPLHTTSTDIKKLISKKCGISVILDNLVKEGSGMRVTVGLADDDDAAILVKQLDGYNLKGHVLYIDKAYKVGNQLRQKSQPTIIHQYNNIYYNNVSYGAIPTCVSQVMAPNLQIPINNPQMPMCNSQMPTYNPQIPTCISQMPISNLQTPICNSQIFINNTQIPTGNAQMLTCNPQITPFNTPTPAFNTETPTCNSQIPTSNTQVPVCNSQMPIWNTQMLTFNPQIPIFNPQIPPLNPQNTTFNSPMSASRPGVPVCNSQIPMSNPQIPFLPSAPKPVKDQTLCTLPTAESLASHPSTVPTNSNVDLLAANSSLNIKTVSQVEIKESSIISKERTAETKKKSNASKNLLTENVDCGLPREVDKAISFEFQTMSPLKEVTSLKIRNSVELEPQLNSPDGTLNCSKEVIIIDQSEDVKSYVKQKSKSPCRRKSSRSQHKSSRSSSRDRLRSKSPCRTKSSMPRHKSSKSSNCDRLRSKSPCRTKSSISRRKSSRSSSCDRLKSKSPCRTKSSISRRKSSRSSSCDRLRSKSPCKTKSLISRRKNSRSSSCDRLRSNSPYRTKYSRYRCKSSRSSSCDRRRSKCPYWLRSSRLRPKSSRSPNDGTSTSKSRYRTKPSRSRCKTSRTPIYGRSRSKSRHRTKFSRLTRSRSPKYDRSKSISPYHAKPTTFKHTICKSTYYDRIPSKSPSSIQGPDQTLKSELIKVVNKLNRRALENKKNTLSGIESDVKRALSFDYYNNKSEIKKKSLSYGKHSPKSSSDMNLGSCEYTENISGFDKHKCLMSKDKIHKIIHHKQLKGDYRPKSKSIGYCDGSTEKYESRFHKTSSHKPRDCTAIYETVDLTEISPSKGRAFGDPYQFSEYKSPDTANFNKRLLTLTDFMSDDISNTLCELVDSLQDDDCTELDSISSKSFFSMETRVILQETESSDDKENIEDPESLILSNTKRSHETPNISHATVEHTADEFLTFDTSLDTVYSDE